MESTCTPKATLEFEFQNKTLHAFRPRDILEGKTHAVLDYSNNRSSVTSPEVLPTSLSGDSLPADTGTASYLQPAESKSVRRVYSRRSCRKCTRSSPCSGRPLAGRTCPGCRCSSAGRPGRCSTPASLQCWPLWLRWLAADV